MMLFALGCLAGALSMLLLLSLLAAARGEEDWAGMTEREQLAMIFWAIVVVGVVLTIAHAIEIYLQLWG